MNTRLVILLSSDEKNKINLYCELLLTYNIIKSPVLYQELEARKLEYIT